MELQDIFDKQIELNEKINPSLYTDIKDPDIRRKWFLNFELALRQESAEAVDSLNWKWWKKDEEDWDNVKIELVDMLHFWVSMCSVSGLDAKEVFELYFKKNKLNHKRQDEGYKEGTYDKYKGGVEDNKRFVINESDKK
ncbi:dUTPase [bacterium]|jgi:dimeric dUTPase (all-alpha-NTP-PPase superfamily)|nr:dUTPase [bacterium]